MSDEFEFADKGNKNIYETERKGFNPGLIVLLFVVAPLLIFLVGNYLLHSYAQKTLPPRKKEASIQEEDEEREVEARSLRTKRVRLLSSDSLFSPCSKPLGSQLSPRFMSRDLPRLNSNILIRS